MDAYVSAGKHFATVESRDTQLCVLAPCGAILRAVPFCDVLARAELQQTPKGFFIDYTRVCDMRAAKEPGTDVHAALDIIARAIQYVARALCVERIAIEAPGLFVLHEIVEEVAALAPDALPLEYMFAAFALVESVNTMLQ
jgi:hypothetical protein